MAQGNPTRQVRQIMQSHLTTWGRPTRLARQTMQIHRMMRDHLDAGPPDETRFTSIAHTPEVIDAKVETTGHAFQAL